MVCGPPGFFVQGILLEWVAISLSRVKILKNMINRNFVNMLLNKIRSNSVFKQKLLLGILKQGENQTVDPFSNKMEEHY